MDKKSHNNAIMCDAVMHIQRGFYFLPRAILLSLCVAIDVEHLEMSDKRPKTILEYIDSAPPKGKRYLMEIYTILKGIAPKAKEAIKWGHPFFIEPRFLFSFSAHKEHLGFATTNNAIDPHRQKIQEYEVTKNGILKIPYNKEFPNNLVKAIAKSQLKLVSARKDDNFW